MDAARHFFRNLLLCIGSVRCGALGANCVCVQTLLELAAREVRLYGRVL